MIISEKVMRRRYLIKALGIIHDVLQATAWILSLKWLPPVTALHASAFAG